MHRATNFTTEETNTLVKLVTKYRHIIENKRTDALTNKEKTETWLLIANSYNNITKEVPRRMQELRTKYDNLKKTVRKKTNDHPLDGKTKLKIYESKILPLLDSRSQPTEEITEQGSSSLPLNSEDNFNQSAEESALENTSLMEFGASEFQELKIPRPVRTKKSEKPLKIIKRARKKSKEKKDRFKDLVGKYHRIADLKIEILELKKCKLQRELMMNRT